MTRPAPVGLAAARVELGSAVSLARRLGFDGRDPRHFGAPPPRRGPLVLPGFGGQVARGASCNCDTIELVAHCHGTHTESVAHLVEEPHDVCDVAPLAPLPALLLSIAPCAAAGSGEDSDPLPRPGDRLLTRAALRAAWPASLPFAPQALVLRTLASVAAGAVADVAAAPAGEDADAAAPYLSRQFAAELVERGIEHLVVELPSIDRGHDEGRLCAHRVFFGLPPRATRLAEARRRQCTVTEFAAIPASLADGPCALQLALPRIAGDAVPSRPLHFRLEAA